MADLQMNEAGGYRFLPGIPAFSEGIVALPGMRVVHARLSAPLAMDGGLALIERHLAEAGRPMAALCGVELRLPAQLEVSEFRALNAEYIATLRDRWKLFLGGVNPVPRCNLALTADPVAAPSLHAFSYTLPGAVPRPQFVTAGINDAVLVYGPDAFRRIASGAPLARQPDAPASGDGSEQAVARRLGFILDVAARRLAALGATWADASQVELYLSHPLGDLMRSLVLPAIAPAGRRGLRWYAGLAPFHAAEAEMDVRGFTEEIEVWTAGDEA